VRLARRHGVWEEDLLSGLDITAAELGDPRLPVRPEIEAAAVRNLLSILGNPAELGAEAGLDVPVRSGRDWRKVLSTCSTFGDALGTSVQLVDLTSSYVKIGIAVAAAQDVCDVTFDVIDEPDRAAELFHLVRVMVASAVIAREILGRPLPVRGVRMAFEQPAAHAQLDHMMGAAAFWNARDTAVTLDLDVFALPLPDADQDEHDAALERCQQLLRRHAGRDGTAGQVRRIMAARDASVWSFDAVAEELSLTQRTLRRRLAHEGTSFREVLDATRMSAADELFRQGASVAQVAEQLGYAHQSAFAHAFKRWAGLSPDQWRRKRVT
jgi:AraC-like DNA-binding protein